MGVKLVRAALGNIALAVLPKAPVPVLDVLPGHTHRTQLTEQAVMTTLHVIPVMNLLMHHQQTLAAVEV